MLPDDALLEVFYLYVNDEEHWLQEAWQTLVHVCRRWRSLVFGSPHSLNLQLICGHRTRVRDMLDLWPPFPLVIESCISCGRPSVDNIVAVLEHRSRVCRIRIRGISSSGLEKVLAAMQEPFPELTQLELEHGSYAETATVLPDSLLGGSAPRLRILYFRGIPYPRLPKLLLSATHLTNVFLSHIPHSGYFSPDAIATALSTLTRLGDLYLGFESPLSLPDQETRLPPSPKRFVLPVLTKFWFKGVSEYLNDLLAHINAPRLKILDITFFNQVLFNTPQLIQFINRTSALKAPEKARVIFIESSWSVIELSSRAADFRDLSVTILCERLDWQVSALEQVCTLCLPHLSTLEDLYMRSNWQDNVENALWPELFQPFAAVKNLYLSRAFAPRIVPSMQELVGERTTEVLPALQNIFLEGLETSGPIQEGIQQFAARQQASHPIAVSSWGGGSTESMID